MERGNLVIGIRVGESIDIGDDITITLLSRDGNQSRLNIEAPRSTTILRDTAVVRHPKIN